MSQKKTSIKRSTLGLVIICVLLVAALGGIIIYYANTVNDKDNQINDLNSKLNGLLSFITTLTEVAYTGSNITGAIADLNYTYNLYVGIATSEELTINSLDTNITNLNVLLGLNDSAVWVNNNTVSEPVARLGMAWYNWTFPASYAGYVSINVSSASAESWAHSEYSAYGVNFSDQIDVGTNGTAYFPVLPSSNITVGVGNGNPSSGATQTVTITYYY